MTRQVPADPTTDLKFRKLMYDKKALSRLPRVKIPGVLDEPISSSSLILITTRLQEYKMIPAFPRRRPPFAQRDGRGGATRVCERSQYNHNSLSARLCLTACADLCPHCSTLKDAIIVSGSSPRCSSSSAYLQSRLPPDKPSASRVRL